LGQPTRENIPLNGIALDNLLAVNENPLRILSRAEAASAKEKLSEPICSISGLPSTVNGQEVAADVGGQPVFFCGRIHALQFNTQLVAAESGGTSSEASQ